MNSPGHRANILNATYTEIGVAVKHALPGVGRNLRDHYAVRVSALVKGEVPPGAANLDRWTRRP